MKMEFSVVFLDTNFASNEAKFANMLFFDFLSMTPFALGTSFIHEWRGASGESIEGVHNSLSLSPVFWIWRQRILLNEI